jgi:hypothetical protein
VHRGFKSIELTGAEKGVEVLISTRRLTTWMPGTRPGMTLKASCEPLVLVPIGLVSAIHAGTFIAVSKLAQSGAEKREL